MALRLGLFGGSFDPPHICHVLFCVWVLEMEKIDKILWAPCVEHPFGKAVAPFEHRLEMSRLAARGLGARVEVSDIEGDLPRPSYTIHTVEALHRRMPEAHISVLVGSDILDEINRWERIDELRQKADLVVVPRGGFIEAADAMTVSLPRLSSSEVRAALRESRSVKDTVTPPVLEYIERNRLYRT